MCLFDFRPQDAVLRHFTFLQHFVFIGAVIFNSPLAFSASLQDSYAAAQSSARPPICAKEYKKIEASQLGHCPDCERLQDEAVKELAEIPRNLRIQRNGASKKDFQAVRKAFGASYGLGVVDPELEMWNANVAKTKKALKETDESLRFDRSCYYLQPEKMPLNKVTELKQDFSKFPTMFEEHIREPALFKQWEELVSRIKPNVALNSKDHLSLCIVMCAYNFELNAETADDLAEAGGAEKNDENHQPIKKINCENPKEYKSFYDAEIQTDKTVRESQLGSLNFSQARIDEVLAKRKAGEKPITDPEQYYLGLNNASRVCEINAAELMTIKHYTGDGYDCVNDILRGGEGKNCSRLEKQSVASFVRVMNSGLSKLAPFNGTVYRGGMSLPDDVLKAHTANAVIRYSSYMSSSKRQKVASQFGTRYKYVIKSKTGVAVESLSATPNEDEVIFPPHTPFKITKVEANEKTTTFYLEEI